MRRIIEAVFAVIIALVSGFGGYKLNDYLSRDNISIQRVYVIADTTKLSYPSKAMMDLYYNSRYQIYSLYRAGVASGLIAPSLYRDSERRFLQNEQIAEITTVLDNFSKFNEELQVKENAVVQRLENYKSGDSIADIIPSLRNSRLSVTHIPTNNDAEKVKVMLDILKGEKGDAESANQHVANILHILKSFKPERTGMVKIKVILLNSGDTDGLIKEHGKLNFTTQNDSLPIIEDNEPVNLYGISYVRGQSDSVPKRAMIQKVFIIHESKAGKESMDYFQNLVKKVHQLQCQ